ncbi:MAG: succinyldiaminopimelate transaminase [Halofilum sp. (in: g-proteobacteria)]
MHSEFDRLQPYPFERLAALVADVEPPSDRATLSLSIGEPQHEPPALAGAALREALDGLSTYPATRGSGPLRDSIAQWLERRYAVAVDPERQVLPVNGTREALFGFAQTVIDRGWSDAAVLVPNPLYQIYEGAALLAGAEPVYYPAGGTEAPHFDAIPDPVWERCHLLYICSPGNPTGAVLDRPTLRALIERAHAHDFIIAADECYGEIYRADGAPPPGLLEVAQEAGYADFSRCVAFHSLSKRSNLPGLRSGFVAGDANLIADFARYRTYQGGAMAPPTQAASLAAWNDEAHVEGNRRAYDEKFAAVLGALGGALEVEAPDASFYLWPRTPVDDTRFARELLAEEGVRVLPGQYLSRETDGDNPGADRIRVALVPPLDDCVEAARRIRRFLQTNYPN